MSPSIATKNFHLIGEPSSRVTSTQSPVLERDTFAHSVCQTMEAIDRNLIRMHFKIVSSRHGLDKMIGNVGAAPPGAIAGLKIAQFFDRFIERSKLESSAEKRSNSASNSIGLG